MCVCVFCAYMCVKTDESSGFHSTLPTPLLLYPLSRNLFISVRCVSQQEFLIAGREASSTNTHTHTHSGTCTPMCTHFPISSVSHFYICNPCSFVILFLPVGLKREKLISGVKRDYQMQTKSLHLQTKMLMSTFHGNKK